MLGQILSLDAHASHLAVRIHTSPCRPLSIHQRALPLTPTLDDPLALFFNPNAFDQTPDIHNRHSPASVVDDLADNTTDVTVLLGKVEVAVTRGVLVVVRVGLEDPTRLPLGTNDTLQVSKRKLVVAESSRTYTHCLRALSAMRTGLQPPRTLTTFLV